MKRLRGAVHNNDRIVASNDCYLIDTLVKDMRDEIISLFVAEENLIAIICLSLTCKQLFVDYNQVIKSKKFCSQISLSFAEERFNYRKKMDGDSIYLLASISIGRYGTPSLVRWWFKWSKYYDSAAIFAGAVTTYNEMILDRVKVGIEEVQLPSSYTSRPWDKRKYRFLLSVFGIYEWLAVDAFCSIIAFSRYLEVYSKYDRIISQCYNYSSGINSLIYYLAVNDNVKILGQCFNYWKIEQSISTTCSNEPAAFPQSLKIYEIPDMYDLIDGALLGNSVRVMKYLIADPVCKIECIKNITDSVENVRLCIEYGYIEGVENYIYASFFGKKRSIEILELLTPWNPAVETIVQLAAHIRDNKIIEYCINKYGRDLVEKILDKIKISDQSED
jgi:hypothetical protein